MQDITTTTAEVTTTAKVKKVNTTLVASEKGKSFIDELCKELQVKGKTDKLIDLPAHAAVDLLIEIATDFRFRSVTTETETGPITETFDRFEEYALRFESERNSDKPETAEELQRSFEQIKAKLEAMGFKA